MQPADKDKSPPPSPASSVNIPLPDSPEPPNPAHGLITIPDFFEIARNNWDEDWGSEDDDDDNAGDLLFSDPYGNSVQKSEIKFEEFAKSK